MASSEPANDVECPLCDKRFRRPDHMRRHQLSHVTEKPFECIECRRAFSRSDALQRHQLTHNQNGPNLLQRKARACRHCASARVRCTADSPSCARCLRKGLNCLYPEARKSRTRSDSEANQEAFSPSHGEASSGTPKSSPSSTIVAQQNQAASTLTNLNLRENAQVAEGGRSSYETSPITQGSMVQRNGYGTVDQAMDVSFAFQQMQGYSGPSPNAFGFDFDNSGMLSSLNWLPLDSDLIYQDASPENTESSSWPQQFGQYPNSVPSDQVTNVHPQWNMVEDSVNQITPGGANEEVHESMPADDHSIHASSSSKETVASGEFYLDGDGARLPKIKRRRIRTRTSEDNSSLTLSLHVPDDGHEVLAQLKSPGTQLSSMSSEAHRALHLLFDQTCIDCTPQHIRFSSAEFPTLETFTKLVHLYFEHFHPVFPFLHPTTFDLGRENYVLVLAIAAIGSHYSERIGSTFIHSIEEFVRRVLNLISENGISIEVPTATVYQVKMLCSISMLYCGDEFQADRGQRYHSELSDYCLSLRRRPEQPSYENEEIGVESRWKQWIELESERRTGYCIWLLDTLWAFHFDQRPILTLADADETVPCHEKVWNASNATDWQHVAKRPSCRLCEDEERSLLAEIEYLYVEKRLHHHVGEFSRILIIHGLFRRNWEVEAYLRQPFSRWEPSAHQPGPKAPSSRQIWMPANSTYSHWRNATCDCLDLLHWSANASIGRASGMEHPTVLHLHLARVILLTPYKSILLLARASQKENSLAQAHARSVRHIVQLWATKDQYKARLAMIHAGVLFWHVRRYSSNAFYEPSSVFLATLALWAYSSFATRPRNQEDRQPHGVDSPLQDSHTRATSDEPEMPLINLDRPTDDELVQLFVKNGSRMYANVTGVGDIHGQDGPSRILREGRKLISTLDCWSIGERLTRFLDAMLESSTAWQARISELSN